MTHNNTTLPNILFACTHNKIRSPMAEALTKTMYQAKIAHIDSCGIDDGGGIGDGFTVAVMREIGIDLLNHTPKSFTDRLNPKIDLVICFSEASFETASPNPRTQHCRNHLLPHLRPATHRRSPRGAFRCLPQHPRQHQSHAH